MLTQRFIDRLRLLPYSGQVIVEENDWVTEEQVVARIDYMPGRMMRHDVAPKLRVDGKALRDHMLLPEGAPVEVGDPLAASYDFGSRQVVTSPYGGFVGLVSKQLGHVYIREPIPVGSGEPEVLDIPALLGVRPIMVGDCLRVIVGNAVVPGQVVAIRRASGKTQLVQSSIYGKVKSIEDGVVTIIPLHVRTELSAYLAGKVIDVVPGQSVTVRAYGYLVQGQYGVGGETGGPLLLFGQPDSVMTPCMVKPDWKDKVVVVGATASLEAMQTAAEAGVKALVMAHLPLRTLLQFSNNTSTMGLTGDEDVPCTVVLTEGFMPMPMSQRYYATFQSLDGRYAGVNGTTHIRAGVIRPEVIICESEWPEGDVANEKDVTELAVGQVVRITRDPHAGLTGIILGLPVQRQVIPTGSKVRIAEVQLPGQVVEVPVSNLDVWGETEADERG
jgi:hypothetical protein